MHGTYLNDQLESPSDSVLFLAYDLTPGTSGTVQFHVKAWSGSEATLTSSTWLIPPYAEDYEASAYQGESRTYNNPIVQTSPWNPLSYTDCSNAQTGDLVFQQSPGLANAVGHVGIIYRDSSDNMFVYENLKESEDFGRGTRFTPWNDFQARTGKGWQGCHPMSLTEPEQDALYTWMWANSANAEDSAQGSRIDYGICAKKCTDVTYKAYEDALGRDLIPGYRGQTTDPPAYIFELLTGDQWPTSSGRMLSILGGDLEQFKLCSLSSLDAIRYRALGIIVQNSWDPNEKIGLNGYGPEHFIRGDQEIPYLVYFENHPDSATLSARLVSVTDTLDVTKFDMSTFSLGSIIVGDSIITPPSDTLHWTGIMDFPDTIDVGITVDVDTLTGILTWQFETLDSITGLPPEDQLKGFLPINTNPPEGEGHVEFTVMVWTLFLRVLRSQIGQVSYLIIMRRF